MGYDVVGVDPSASGITQARRHASASLRFEIASTADNLQSRFGEPVVVSLEVIEHCPSAREFIHAFSSVLAPGGLGIISTPYHGYLKNLLLIVAGRFDQHFDPLWEGGNLRFFSVAKLRALLPEANLVSVAFHRVGRLPMIAKSVVAVVRKGTAAGVFWARSGPHPRTRGGSARAVASSTVG
jgi:2-polyprenyl-6-hydroxyphenyl methylase/3-demethylubiquinone-9 3-methyltransferase